MLGAENEPIAHESGRGEGHFFQIVGGEQLEFVAGADFEAARRIYVNHIRDHHDDGVWPAQEGGDPRDTESRQSPHTGRTFGQYTMTWMIPRVWLSGSLLSVIAVVWMGSRLLEQDRSLELQQQRQAIESAADAAAVLIEKSILNAEQEMLVEGWSPEGGSGALLVRFRGDRLTSAPGQQLLFTPFEARRTPEAGLFREAERQEFAGRDMDRVEARYRELARSEDRNVKAGALVRLARVLAGRGDARGAGDCYLQLSRLDDARYEEIPAPLVAHLARGDGRALATALDHPKLLPSRDAFLFHAGQAAELTKGQWKPDGAKMRLSEAVAAHWPAASGSGRRSDGDITVLWRREGDDIAILAASAGYVGHWSERAEAAAAGVGCRLRIGEAPAGAVTRTASATGLPWTISLERASGGEPTLLSGRRRLLALGTLALAAMLLATGYFTYRAFQREVAAARMQSDFVAAVSHEFRTPLTALRQFTTILADRDTLTEAQRRTCYEAQMRSTERLSRLVESLLDFRRMEAGARRYVMERLDAAEFSRHVCGEFHREVGIEVQLEAPDAAWIEADSGALSLALWNLLDNAVKYAPGSPVGLHVALNGGAVRISVTDHGPGVAAAEQSRIFEKFVRGRDAEQLGVRGTGIGLAMVKQIAEAHRGRVELRSAAGGGSVFTMIIPGAAG